MPVPGVSAFPAMRMTSAACVFVLLLFQPACATKQLMPAPALYAARGENPFENTPEMLRTQDVKIIYATDRLRDEEQPDTLAYGHLRASHLVTGLSTVRFGEVEDWDTLVTQSMTSRRTLEVSPYVVSNEELVAWPSSERRVDWFRGDEAEKRAVEADFGAAENQVCDLVRKQLAQTDLKEVFIFVHGYNVPFDDSITTIAELWHFMGRQGVPIAYSWPAGRGGLRGYTTDRESGEYTVMHLKSFIESLAKCPELEKINILAHSRGTDVTLTALRELQIAYRNRGLESKTALKLGGVVLAAADLDLQVALERVSAEGIPFMPNQLTLYISKEDRALSASAWLFDSLTRLGTLTAAALTPAQKQRVVENKSLEIVDARVKRADAFGHSYFHQDPSVSSDVILSLKEHRLAGAANGRPLAYEDSFWVINPGYPVFE